MIRVQRRSGLLRCVVCREVDGFMVTCSSCSATYHGECVPKCPTLGCVPPTRKARRPLGVDFSAPRVVCECRWQSGACSRCRARWADREQERRAMARCYWIMAALVAPPLVALAIKLLGV